MNITWFKEEMVQNIVCILTKDARYLRIYRQIYTFYNWFYVRVCVSSFGVVDSRYANESFLSPGITLQLNGLILINLFHVTYFHSIILGKTNILTPPNV